jgi:hypothetical protein
MTDRWIVRKYFKIVMDILKYFARHDRTRAALPFRVDYQFFQEIQPVGYF